jgi:hypothetical protein
MQKVVGSSPIIRSTNPRKRGFFVRNGGVAGCREWAATTRSRRPSPGSEDAGRPLLLAGGLTSRLVRRKIPAEVEAGRPDDDLEWRVGGMGRRPYPNRARHFPCLVVPGAAAVAFVLHARTEATSKDTARADRPRSLDRRRGDACPRTRRGGERERKADARSRLHPRGLVDRAGRDRERAGCGWVDHAVDASLSSLISGKNARNRAFLVKSR